MSHWRAAVLVSGLLATQHGQALTVVCHNNSNFPGSGHPTMPMASTLWSEALITQGDLTAWTDVLYYSGNATGPGCTPICAPHPRVWWSFNEYDVQGIYQVGSILLITSYLGPYTFYAGGQMYYVEPNGDRFTSGEEDDCQETGRVRPIIGNGPR